MRTVVKGLLAMMMLVSTSSAFTLVFPTAHKNVNLYVGLLGSSDNPAYHQGCYDMNNTVFTGKQLIEYNYTVSNCVESANRFNNNMNAAESTDTFTVSGTEDFLHHVLTHAGTFQLGVNFDFNS